MQLMPWRSRSLSPFSPLTGLQQEINRMFVRVFEDFPGGNGREAGENVLTPALDIKEDDQWLTVCPSQKGLLMRDK